MYVYKYILKNLDSLLTASLLTDSEASLGLIAHLITFVDDSERAGLTTVSQFVPRIFSVFTCKINVILA